MDFASQALADLATGAGVAALSSSSAAGSDAPWLAACGAALGVSIVWLESRFVGSHPFPLLGLARSLLSLVLSAAQFFNIWETLDRDMGAILVAIPLFFCACAPPAAALPQYVRGLTTVSAVFNVACVLAGLIYFSTAHPNGVGEDPSHYDGALRRALVVSDVALAASRLSFPQSQQALATQQLLAPQPGRLWVAAARGAAFFCLALFPAELRGLQLGPLPDWLVVLYGMALVQSVHVHACCVRLGFFSGFVLDSPQRSLMLLVAPALTVAFVERSGDPAHASFAVLALLGAGLLQLLVPGKDPARSK
jgi:hypothetical protein